MIPQAREIIQQRDSPENSLSIYGLFIQALIFLLVGVSFIFRLRLPDEDWDGIPGRPEESSSFAKFMLGMRMWFRLVGWATIDNLIFAFTKGVLGMIALRRRRKRARGNAGDGSVIGRHPVQ